MESHVFAICKLTFPYFSFIPTTSAQLFWNVNNPVKQMLYITQLEMSFYWSVVLFRLTRINFAITYLPPSTFDR